jgi:phage gpG-like protein
MRVKISMECDADAVIRRLQAMQARSENFSPLFRDARTQLEKANAQNFATGGLPVGGWDPRKRDYAWPIMKRTGKLLNSLTNLRGAPNVITPTFAEFGTNVEYAKFHQYGTEKMAARKIVFNPTGFSQEMARKALGWVVRGDIP